MKYETLKEKFIENIEDNKKILDEFNEKQAQFIELFQTNKRLAMNTYHKELRNLVLRGYKNDDYLVKQIENMGVKGEIDQQLELYVLLKENPPLFGSLGKRPESFKPSAKTINLPPSFAKPISTNPQVRFNEYQALETRGEGLRGIESQGSGAGAGVSSNPMVASETEAEEQPPREGTTQTLIDDNVQKPQQEQSSTEPLAEFLEAQETKEKKEKEEDAKNMEAAAKKIEAAEATVEVAPSVEKAPAVKASEKPSEEEKNKS